MNCKVCGSQNQVSFRNRSGMFLCLPCHDTTPKKVSREVFDKAYWNLPLEHDVPESTKREFYSDYRSSTCTLSEYINQTTEPSNDYNYAGFGY